jgi:hypothetical protein
MEFMRTADWNPGQVVAVNRAGRRRHTGTGQAGLDQLHEEHVVEPVLPRPPPVVHQPEGGHVLDLGQ